MRKVLFSGRTQELLGNQNSVTSIKPEYSVDLNRVIEVVNQMGYEATVVDGVVQAPVESYFGATINRTLFEAGITLSSISTQQPTLEETFFEMTGE